MGAVEAFCRDWFERRDAEAAIGFLSDAVDFVGTGEDELARGKEEMSAYLRADVGELREPFACVLEALHEQMAAEHVCCLSAEMTLKNTQYTWRLRIFCTLVREDGETWLVRSLHFAEPGGSQRGKEHYPQTLVAVSYTHRHGAARGGTGGGTRGTVRGSADGTARG